MPVVNYKRIPLCLETEVLKALEDQAKASGINRTKLVRTMVKYCLQHTNIKAVLKHGDKPFNETS
jgi:hypothetical protein